MGNIQNNASRLNHSTYILIGPQGSGKGTQARFMIERYKLQYIATGDVFRETATTDNELGRKIKGLIESGVLVPDNLTMEMFRQRLLSLDRSRGILFDGIPRNLTQAKLLDELLNELGMPLPIVIHLHIDRNTAIQRLVARKVCQVCGIPYLPADASYASEVCAKCGGKVATRKDDMKESIERRLQQYYEQTEPMLEYYRQSQRLISIDGEPPVDDVTAQIHQAINKLMKKEQN